MLVKHSYWFCVSVERLSYEVLYFFTVKYFSAFGKTRNNSNSNLRSSRTGVFYEKGFLRNFANFTEKFFFSRVSLLIKPQPAVLRSIGISHPVEFWEMPPKILEITRETPGIVLQIEKCFSTSCLVWQDHSLFLFHSKWIPSRHTTSFQRL